MPRDHAAAATPDWVSQPTVQPVTKHTNGSPGKSSYRITIRQRQDLIHQSLQRHDLRSAMKQYIAIRNGSKENRATALHLSNTLFDILKALRDIKQPSESLLTPLEFLKNMKDNVMDAPRHWFYVMFDELIRGKPDEALNILRIYRGDGGQGIRDTYAVPLAAFVLQQLQSKGKVNGEQLLEDMKDYRIPSIKVGQTKAFLARSSLPKELVDACLESIKYVHYINMPNMVLEIGHLTRQGNRDGLKTLYEQLDVSLLSPALCGRFINAFYQTGAKDFAVRAWVDLIDRGEEPDETCWIAMIEHGKRGQDPAVTRGIWERMISTGVEPDIASYSAYMGAMFRNRDVNGALQVFDEMRAKGIEVNQISVNTLIQGLLREQNDTIFRLLDRIVKGQISGDIWWYNTVMRALIKRKQFSEVPTVLNAMKTHGVKPDVVTYATIIDGLFKGRTKPSEEKLQALLQEMRESGIEPNVQCYTTIIDGFATRNEEAAQRMLQEMKDNNVAPNVFTYTALINGLMKQVKPQLAQHYFDEMQSRRVSTDAAVWNRLIDGYGMLRQIDHMMQKYEQMKFMADKGVLPNKYTYSNILNALAKEDRADLAEEVVADMSRAGFKVKSDGLASAIARVRSIGAKIDVVQLNG